MSLFRLMEPMFVGGLEAHLDSTGQLEELGQQTGILCPWVDGTRQCAKVSCPTYASDVPSPLQGNSSGPFQPSRESEATLTLHTGFVPLRPHSFPSSSPDPTEEAHPSRLWLRLFSCPLAAAI